MIIQVIHRLVRPLLIIHLITIEDLNFHCYGNGAAAVTFIAVLSFAHLGLHGLCGVVTAAVPVLHCAKGLGFNPQTGCDI